MGGGSGCWSWVLEVKMLVVGDGCGMLWWVWELVEKGGNRCRCQLFNVAMEGGSGCWRLV